VRTRLRMSCSKILLLALPLALFACAATPESPEADDETSEEAYTSSKDVTADYVGAYKTAPNAPEGDVTSLRLRKDRTIVIVRAGATAEGKHEVRKTASATKLRLTVQSGTSRSKRTFKLSLGAEPFRPILEITRSRKTSLLERQLTSCASVNCLTGMGCDVVETDGVPGPVCSPRTPACKTALATYDLWGAGFYSVTPGTYGHRGSLSCGVSVSTSYVTCGTVGWNGWAMSAPIAFDGTFLTGTPLGDDNYLAGALPRAAGWPPARIG
jgi:hypothetical protein